jgi:hypothetical protein
LKTAEKVGDDYGSQNPKPSKYEKKLRNIFSELKNCEHITLKNKERSNEILAQKGIDEATANQDSDKIDNSEMFKMVKHPDQKKYMHYALQNADGQWLQWDDKNGVVSAGPKLSWLAMLPVNENEYKESGWLIKQDKFYLSMPQDSTVRAKIFESVPKARDLNNNHWDLTCIDH